LKRQINNVAKKKAMVAASKRMSSNPGSRQGDLQHLERIFELMEKHEVAELEWERSGERLRLKTRYSSPENLLLSSSHSGSSYREMDSRGASYDPVGSMRVSVASSTASPSSGSPSNAGATSASASPALKQNQKQILSPFVGTFYRSPSPDKQAYVKEGQSVTKGDVLCIVEAMKLMNEIEADFPGKIVSVLVENGQPVEFGEPLFLIEL
jgi:acetyl-CoA carboxylase biotin carboxyl carrier protein